MKVSPGNLAQVRGIQPILFVVATTVFQQAEGVHVADFATLGVQRDVRTHDVKERHHGFVAHDLQSVRFARTLVNKGAGPRDPLVFLVLPGTLQAK